MSLTNDEDLVEMLKKYTTNNRTIILNAFINSYCGGEKPYK